MLKKLGLLLLPLLALVSCTNEPVDTSSDSSSVVTSSSSTVNTYTVTWKNWDGTVLETDTDVTEGDTPTYDGATPTKGVTAEEKAEVAWYEFAGWDTTVTTVTADVTYTATYTAVYTYDLVYADCATAVTNLFGANYVNTFVTDEWTAKKVVRFTVNVGSQLTPEQAGTTLNNLLTTAMGYTAVSAVALDTESGYYVGTYLNSTTGVVAYPLTAQSGTNTIMQVQFTHYNVLA